MPESLRDTVARVTPQPTIAAITAQLNSNYGRQKTFVIVEGQDDVDFYRKFFKGSTVCDVYASVKEIKNSDGKAYLPGGKNYLRDIVKFIINKWTDKIIGITDYDDYRFIPSHQFPQNVFPTDHRDLEMTALDTQHAKAALNAIDTTLKDKLNENEQPLRMLGLMRVCSKIFDLGLDFKNIKFTKIVDQNACVNGVRQLKADWEDILSNLFWLEFTRYKKGKKIQHNGLKYKLLVVCWLITTNNLNADSYDLCQGHDTMGMLAYRYSDEKLHSQKNIKNAVLNSYDIKDFHASQLYKTIQKWQSIHNVNILK